MEARELLRQIDADLILKAYFPPEYFSQFYRDARENVEKMAREKIEEGTSQLNGQELQEFADLMALTRRASQNEDLSKEDEDRAMEFAKELNKIIRRKL